MERMCKGGAHKGAMVHEMAHGGVHKGRTTSWPGCPMSQCIVLNLYIGCTAGTSRGV